MSNKKYGTLLATAAILITIMLLSPILSEKPTANVAKKSEVKKPKRHPFMIYEITMTENKRFPYEYKADFHTYPIMSSKLFAIGDTLQFTTLSIWRKREKLQEEIKNLKAELAKRDSVFKTIKLIIDER